MRRLLAGIAGMLLAWIPLAAGAVTITFDDTPSLAPGAAEDAVPDTGFGPAPDYGSVTIDGGFIALAITPTDAAATTLPNVYITTDFLPLADGSLLPGEITGSFASPVSSLSVECRQRQRLPGDDHAHGLQRGFRGGFRDH